MSANETPCGPRDAILAQTYAVRLMQHLVVPTFVLDPNGRVMIWNRACERLTGVPAAKVVGTSEHWRAFYKTKRHCLADIVALGDESELGPLYLEYSVPETGVGLRAENWCVMPNRGVDLYLAIDAGPIYNEAGDLIAVVETLRDMTDQKRAEMELKSLAASDGLTGLANRRTFDKTLSDEWSRALRTQRPLSVLMADVDHFKLFNDHLGHQRGDDCLREIASIMADTVHRPGDLCARYGGEEFAIVMADTDETGARIVAERLFSRLNGRRIPHDAAGAGPFVTLSIGVATIVPQNGDATSTILREADHFLYEAKIAGRNTIRGPEIVQMVDAPPIAPSKGLKRACNPLIGADIGASVQSRVSI